MAKANFAIKNIEVTVWYSICDGESAPCDYCHTSGAFKQEIIIEAVTADGVICTSKTKMYKAAKVQLQVYMKTGTAIHVGRACEERWIAQYKANPHVEFDESSGI